MTLNLNLITDAYIIQASDRRMVSIGTRVKSINDRANKAVIFNTDDGVFTATFHGIGANNGARVDMWLARQLAETGAVELPIAEALPLIAESATNWFSTMPSGIDLRHSFVIAGWLTNASPPRQVSYVVTNFLLGDFFVHPPKARGESGIALRSVLPTALRDFNVVQLSTRRGLVGFQPFGLTSALEKSDVEMIYEVFRSPTAATPEDIEPVLVDVVRRAAGRPAAAGGISKDVLTVVLAPSGQGRSTLYPTSAGPKNFAPFYVWNEQGHNFVVGGGEGNASTDVCWSLADKVFVGSPSGEASRAKLGNRTVNTLGMFFLNAKAKFKTDMDPGAVVNLARVHYPEQAGKGKPIP